MYRKPIKYFGNAILLSMVLAVCVSAQNAKLDFENLKPLEDRAVDVIEVNIDGKLLNLAKRVLLKVKDKDARVIGEAIRDLEAIYVRVLKFERDGEYDVAEVDVIRNQLLLPGWEKLANVRSKKNDQKIDVYTMFNGDDISGLAVIISEKRGIALVNVIGPIDIDLLAELGGKLSIPKIDIEKEDNDK